MQRHVAGTAIALALSGCGTPNPAQEAANDESMRVAQYQVAAKEAMKAALKDPESAKYEEVRAVPFSTGYAFCGKVNSKNGFGGYTGYQRFVAGPTMAATEDTVKDFPVLWTQICSPAGQQVSF